MLINGKHLHISKHAINRFRERFRLYFNASNFQHVETTRALMEFQFAKAWKDIAWKMSPFYYNKTSTRHGDSKTEVYYLYPVFYIVRETDTMILVRTVTTTHIMEKFDG